jgi:adenylate cyclase
MKFKTKLIFLFVMMSLVTNGLLCFINSSQANKMLREQIGATALSIAATTSAMLDGNLHQQLTSSPNEEGQIYKDLEAQLRKIRDANRRDDVQVKFVYTLTPSAKDKDGIVFGVDAEEDGPDKSHLGDIYKQKDDPNVLPTRFDIHQVQPVFVEDQWGTWLTANSPIRSSDGQSVGVVGVDIDAKDVIQQLKTMSLIGLTALGISVLLAMGLAIFLSSLLSRPLANLKNAVVAIGKGHLDTRLDTKSGDEFSEVACAINEMASGLQQRDVFKGTLVRYMSSQLADKILSSGKIPDLKGERRKITVLFADVRGFTALSETLSPEDVFGILNDYFDKMIDEISRNHGMLNKFMGDGLMAVFGAVEEDVYQEENAIKSALGMRKVLDGMRDRLLKERQIDLKIGIGINTGIALVGNIGSSQRMEFTAIGDTVNLGSRLEAATKEFGHDIIVSEYTYVAVRNNFQFHSLGPINIRGRQDPVTAYAVQGEK